MPNKRTSSYHEGLIEDLNDPQEAAFYLNAALEDSDEMFLKALRNVAEAHQVAKVAEEAGVSRESVYRMLRKSGNPTYHSLVGILRALGLKLAVEQEKPEPLSPTAPISKPLPIGEHPAQSKLGYGTAYGGAFNIFPQSVLDGTFQYFLHASLPGSAKNPPPQEASYSLAIPRTPIPSGLTGGVAYA